MIPGIVQKTRRRKIVIYLYTFLSLLLWIVKSINKACECAYIWISDTITFITRTIILKTDTNQNQIFYEILQ